MREFLGCVIRESLTDASLVSDWRPIAERVTDMPDDPDAKVWHTCWYRLPPAELDSRLDQLAAAMRPQWYAHFWCDDDLVVILAGRAFWISIADRATWAPMLAYGDSVGIERKWTERIPTQLPAWVQQKIEISL